MPNYPKYNPAKRVELANQMKALIAQGRLFGENTETGKRIMSATREGNWLDLAIQYFTPAPTEWNTNPEVCRRKTRSVRR